MPPRRNDTLEFMRVVWGLFHALAVRSKGMQRTLGVSGPQRLVIRIVGRRPGVAASEISTALDLHPSTLTGILARLESRGYLTRQTNRDDRRRAHFRLTSRGRVVDALRRGTVEAAVRRALSSLDDADIECARSVLLRLAEELGRETPTATRAAIPRRRSRARPRTR